MKALPLLLLLVLSLARAQDIGDADGSLVTAADIAGEKPADLVQLLRSRVGLDESDGTLAMRGVRGIAVIVDGFASSVSELKTLKPEQVERIDILRGAASARYGAEAMGGAIVVTTRAAYRAHADLVLGYDARHGRYTRLAGGRDVAGFGWSLLAEDRVDKGYRPVPDSPFPYHITVADERARVTTLDGKLGWRGSGLEVAMGFKRLDNGSFYGRPHWTYNGRTDNLRAQLSWAATGTLTLEASLGEERHAVAGSRDHGTGIDAAGLAPERWLTDSHRQREGSLALIWRAAGLTARVGTNLVDLVETYANADYGSRQVIASAESTIRKEAVFASADVPLGAGRLELGGRRDLQRYASFRVWDAGPPAQAAVGGGIVKSATSPKLALSWPLDRGCRLRGGIGTGFSPPAASQLHNGYASAGTVTLANPGLKPERSTTADIALSRAAAAADWHVALFATRWQDKIAMRILDAGVPTVTQPQNVGEVTARGVEAQWSGRIGSWSASANYTHSRTRIARDLADPTLVGKELPDMPRHKANLALAFDAGAGLSVRARLRAVGSAFTDEANTVTDARGYRWKKASYAVLDLAATWRRAAWELTLALDNAFNGDYVTGSFWHGEPRTLRGELTLRY